jgi:hypothetical protein
MYLRIGTKHIPDCRRHRIPEKTVLYKHQSHEFSPHTNRNCQWEGTSEFTYMECCSSMQMEVRSVHTHGVAI